MGLGRLKHGLLIQFKRYVDQLTGSSGKKQSPGTFERLRGFLQTSLSDLMRQPLSAFMSLRIGAEPVSVTANIAPVAQESFSLLSL